MNDQAERLRQMIAKAKGDTPKRAKTIGIASGKGGTGKSSFTVNFCLELSRLEQKVLLFDLDIGMGNVDILLGESPEHSILDFWKKNLSFNEIIEKSPSGFDYIPGGRAFNEFFELKGTHLDAFILELDELTKVYDFIFFDMGAGMTKESLQFLLAADEVFLIVTPEPTSLMDAYSAAKHILLSSPETRMSIMMNKTKTEKEGANAYGRISSVLSKFLSKEPKLLGILPDDPAVMQAVIKRNPITQSFPKAKYSRSIRQAAASFLAVNEGFIGNTSRPSLFMDRLKTLFSSTAGKGG
ncbi:MinD/ParA family protein [Metabacillus sp. KIGAM252]|uniref:MinD/ParA family protein n=1 Tax=Metabacillus flavus TaxID=2823519 RepID=A0ABS5LE50_9BACI|nr:MinD/ParA family protein [Metabacillus flavus]MBS2969002.1 MinD/ParA family protein [Metabacillus flavus]